MAEKLIFYGVLFIGLLVVALFCERGVLMARCIELDKAIEQFCSYGSVFTYGDKVCKAIVSRLKQVPTADVRENVHAHWVYKALEGYPNITFPVCSNCDEDAIDYVESNFCPCCGAVMDEEEPTMEEYMYGQEGSEEDGSL